MFIEYFGYNPPTSFLLRGRRTMKIFQTALFLCISFFIVAQGYALPRFSSSAYLKCQNCHIDPNGGGMRNYYGVMMYGRETLPVHSWSDDSTMMNFTTQLNDYISIGMDMRTLFMYKQRQDYTSFYQMQGDIYLSARLSKKLLLTVTKSLFHDFEIFGIAQILPFNGYVKIGRFTPAYGTKIDDHTAFIRTKTVFPLYRREDTGIEAGISPTLFTWNAGIYNGESGGDPSNGRIRLITTRGEALFRIENINISLGGCVWYNKGAAGTLTMYGGFAGLYYKDISVHAEVDMKKDKVGTGTQELISYLEVNYLLMNGVDLKFMYDFYDPDIDLKTGSESRYSFGVEFFPLPGLEVRPMYRIINSMPGIPQEREFDFLVHLYL
jgi:hypothetical protein